MRCLSPFIAGLLLLWGAGINFATSQASVPELIVERISTANDRTVRVSLFNNRMVVTTVREHGTQVFFRQIVLAEEDYLTYLGAIERDLEAALNPDDSIVSSEIGSKMLLRIRLPSGEIAERFFSSSSTLDLSIARLSATLDDLERVVSEASSSALELASWEPKIGDVVELHSGGLADVIELPGDGRVMLRHRDVSIVEMVPPESLARVVARVVEKK